MKNSQAYTDKKKNFDRQITVYGRNVVLEILEEKDITITKVHLADSNKKDGIISKIEALCERKDIEVLYHSKQALSRISKNAKQDQGVCADIQANSYQSTEDFLHSDVSSYKYIALDSIHNPQNLGMIIRSVAAGFIDGIILPKKGSAKISPLVIKASAGTLFKTKILYCDSLEEVLPDFKKDGADIYALSSHAKESLFDLKLGTKTLFVLGNESEGVCKEVEKLSNKTLSIPMKNGVESLNVAVTAALLAYYS
ncbi:RNA methyltransferase [Sulfurimonas sp. MAG313]|nr:RNA methyltransferase [Sulfurimonas sp. MAG313]MDF1881915.1 RNA methyltransferase [Sulfurimonas sp. MAG313]